MFATLPNPLLAGGHWKVELGCGKRKAWPEVVGVDIHDFGQEIQADLEETPWAWIETESCQLVVCHQTLEHIRNLLPVMEEIWRICEPGAQVEVVVPYGVGKTAIQDPTHVRFFTEETFRYWEPGYVEAWGDYGIEHFFAMCGQRWNEEGNLWTLLQPIKTDVELARWRRLRMASFKRRTGGLPFFGGKPELLKRAPDLVHDPVIERP